MLTILSIAFCNVLDWLTRYNYSKLSWVGKGIYMANFEIRAIMLFQLLLYSHINTVGNSWILHATCSVLIVELVPSHTRYWNLILFTCTHLFRVKTESSAWWLVVLFLGLGRVVLQEHLCWVTGGDCMRIFIYGDSGCGEILQR